MIGTVSAVAGLVDFFFLRHSAPKRWVHAVYLSLIAATFGLATYYFSEYRRMTEAGRQAAALVEQQRMEFTHAGFVEAGLAFLEKHRALYPDTYERAKSVCERHRCQSTDYIAAASEVSGVLKGIATMEK